MGKYRKFTPEYRDEAVRLFIDSGRAIAEVARDLGINEGTLGNWVAKYRADHPVAEELSLSERARLKELEKENRELRMEREFPKKSGSLLRERPTVNDKFLVIAAEKATPHSVYPVVSMCRWLAVSTSGFYDWQAATESARDRRRAKVTIHVQAAFDAGRGSYGVRRVHRVLRRSSDPTRRWRRRR